MQAGHYSSLLPELFRHQTTHVRVFRPQVILLDFHGTISERRWEDKVIFPYVKQSVIRFLQDNWTNDSVQRCLPGLRNESFEQRFRHKYDDAPIIEDQSVGEDLDPGQLAQQMGEFLQWQMNTKRETKETQIIERLVWQDGFKRKQIATPLYDDVLPAVKLWKSTHGCAIYVISSIEPESLKLIFESTDKGNLHQYLSGFVGAKKMGDKLISEIYQKFRDRLVESNALKAGTKSPKVSRASSPRVQSPDSSDEKSKSSSRSTNGNRLVSRPSSPRSSRQSEAQPRPILFLTDSGQEAKAASQVAAGSVYECLLVNRPGNKRIRTYYLSQFQYVNQFTDIEFVAP